MQDAVMSARERLEYVVGSIKQDHADDVYRRFVASLREHGDAHDLDGDDDAWALLAEMESHRGWGSRAKQIRDLAKRSARSRAAEAANEWIYDAVAGLELDTDRDGNVRAHVGNAIQLVRESDEIGSGFKYNEFSGRVERDGTPIEDTDITRVRRDILAMTRADIRATDVTAAVEFVSTSERAYHPVREYLDSLEWDGIVRVPTALEDFFGVQPNESTRAISRAWFVGCVKRIYRPGCKFDEMLILCGDQGLRKSTGLRDLFSSEWFGDTPIELNANMKDVYQGLPGCWAYEVAECDRWLTYANASRMKSLLSVTTLKYRKSYGRYQTEQPMQTVFVGTTNKREHLTDPTGSRRYLSVTVVDEIDTEAIAAVRDQLWAEAVERLRAGERSYLSPEEHAAHAESVQVYEEERPETALVARWLRHRPWGPFSTADVLVGALEVPAERVNSGRGKAVAEVLRSLGYEKRRGAPLGDGPTPWHRPWVWVRVDPD